MYKLMFDLHNNSYRAFDIRIKNYFKYKKNHFFCGYSVLDEFIII